MGNAKTSPNFEKTLILNGLQGQTHYVMIFMEFLRILTTW